MIPGVDVSSAQGTIDWQQAAGVIQFGFTKASEGTGYLNPTFVPNLRGMRAAGILPGCYHFALPATNNPADEAVWFLRCVQGYLQPGEVVALDLEDDPYGGTLPSDVGSWALAWLNAVETALGTKPLVYTNRNLIDNYSAGAIAAQGFGLWLAAPGVSNPPVSPWPFAAIQQTSWTGSVPGISGNVDLDTFFGDATAFKRYGLPQPAPPVDPCADLRVTVAQLQQQLDAANTRIAAALLALGGGS